jgi:hypothetical protein
VSGLSLSLLAGLLGDALALADDGDEGVTNGGLFFILIPAILLDDTLSESDVSDIIVTGTLCSDPRASLGDRDDIAWPSNMPLFLPVLDTSSDGIALDDGALPPCDPNMSPPASPPFIMLPRGLICGMVLRKFGAGDWLFAFLKIGILF